MAAARSNREIAVERAATGAIGSVDADIAAECATYTAAMRDRAGLERLSHAVLARPDVPRERTPAGARSFGVGRLGRLLVRRDRRRSLPRDRRRPTNDYIYRYCLAGIRS